MSGTGKSTVIEKLAALGYEAIDLDSNEYSEWVEVDPNKDSLTPLPGKDWRWKTARVQQLLQGHENNFLIVSGCAENMGQFFPKFDDIILLKASSQVIIKRLAERTNNPYGKQPHEMKQVLALKEIIEPVLQKKANHEIDTDKDIDKTIAEVLAILKSI